MNWTTETPTKEGAWYLQHEPEHGETNIVLCYRLSGGILGGMGNIGDPVIPFYLLSGACLWYGPIQPPPMEEW